jgi:hypothetical protein
MAEWKIPEPLQIDWTMRQVSSANLTTRDLGDGRKRFVLEHAPLPDVRPEMMVWFLKNMNRTDMEWGGHKGVLAYRYWHPRDHVHFEILGKPGPGCRFKIVEAFQAGPKYLGEGVFNVPKLDLSGFRLERRILGSIIVSADEDFSAISEGMRYRVTMTLGSANPIVRRLTDRRVHRFISDGFQAWHRHNVEEVGNLPHFLPDLYAAYAKA